MSKENLEKKEEEKEAKEVINESEANSKNTSEETLTEEEKNLDPVESLNKQLEEEKGKYLRLYAEFENFRRRNAKERLELIGTASSDVIKDLLPVLDDFQRAIDSNDKIDDINVVKEGFSILSQKLSKILEAKGLKPIESKGQPFDAELHEAVAQMPTDKASKKGIILDEVEKGYTLNEKIIRHPKVVVAS